MYQEIAFTKIIGSFTSSMKITRGPFLFWVSMSTSAVRCCARRSRTFLTSTSAISSTNLSSTTAFLSPFRSRGSVEQRRKIHLTKAAGAAQQQQQQRKSFYLRMSSSETAGTSPSDDASSSLLKVALCQFHVTHDKEENIKNAKKFLSMASERGAKLAILPEIWNSPYATSAFPEYAEIVPEMGDDTKVLIDDIQQMSSKMLIDAAKELNMWIVGGSIPEKVVVDDADDTKIYNTCLVLNPEGEIVAKHRKVHLFDIDVPGGITFFESETLSPGETVSHFTTPYGEIGLGICYDIRFAEYAMLLRQKYGCKVIIYPGAFNMTTGPAHWELLQRARAVDNQCFILTASPARTIQPDKESKYPHYTAWGHSTAVSPWGDIVATTEEKEGLVIADLDLSKVEEIRRNIPIGNQRRSDIYDLKQV